MRLHIVLLVGFTLGMAGCSEKEQAAPEPEMEATATEPANDMDAALSGAEAEIEAAVPDETVAVIEGWRDEALLELMHVRAERLDEINYALDDGELEKARMPAKWLASHKKVEGLPDSLVPFADGIRAAAVDIENATDIPMAKAAAQRIVAQCQACHAATGANIQ